MLVPLPLNCDVVAPGWGVDVDVHAAFVLGIFLKWEFASPAPFADVWIALSVRRHARTISGLAPTLAVAPGVPSQHGASSECARTSA